jgi:hypothetical protein
MKWLYFTILSCIVASCANENDLTQISIGDDFIRSQTNFVIIDTFTVSMSTVLVDSIPTSGTGEILVGEYSDKSMGIINSQSFFQIGPPKSQSINAEAVFDSLVLELNYSTQIYGDTLPLQELNVFRVNDDIELLDNYYIYNTSTFQCDETPIGSLQFYPRPKSETLLTVRLNDELGINFMNLMKDEASEITNSEKFVEYFKGISLKPGSKNSCIYSFQSVDSLVNMVLYTHYIEADRIEKSYKFPLYATNTCFNHVEADRNGTFIENIKTQREELLSASTGNMAFLQAGTGLVTRLDFPGIDRMLEMGFRNILYKAELVLKPVGGLYKPAELPSELVLFNTDKYNQFGSAVVNTSDETVYASFSLDEVYGVNTFYRFDLTNYFINEFADGYVNPENGIIVSFTEDKMKKSLERVAFDARNGTAFKPTLKLYYIFYN